VFILSVAKEIEDRLTRKNAKLIIYRIGELLIEKTKQLEAVFVKKDNVFKLAYWQDYLQNV
jgi:hypothetical protein